MIARSLGKVLLGVGGLIALDLNTTAPAAAQTSAGGLPQKAEVVYRGTTDGRIGAPVRVSVRVPRRLTLRGVAGAVDVPERRRTSGAVTLRLTFDGAAVTGRMYGTGALRPDSLSGAVENGVCRLSNTDGTSVWEGRCDARGFSGTFKSNATGGLVMDGRFETSAERVSDLAAAPVPPPPPSSAPSPQGPAGGSRTSTTPPGEAPAWWRNKIYRSQWPIVFADDSVVITYDAQRARSAGANQILVDSRIDMRAPEELRGRAYDALIQRRYLDCAAMREMTTETRVVSGSTTIASTSPDTLQWKSTGSRIISRICTDLRGGVALRPVDPADRTPAAGPNRAAATTYGARLDTARLAGVPATGKTTFQLTASMSNIDDIGEIYVLSDGAQGRLALVCAWSGGRPGEGSVGLDSYLNVGKNIVVFALYDRRVVGMVSMLTQGRWGYRFQLSDHAGTLWSANGAGATNVEGFRYVYAIHIRREPSGTIRVMPQLTAADRARINDSTIPSLARAIEGGGLNTTDLAGRSSCDTGGWGEEHTVYP